MMHLAVVTTGTLFGCVALHEGDAGLVIARDVLEVLGVHDGDELEVHTDGRMLILIPRERERPKQPVDG
ncbi:MAG TPA: hypothetical protein VGK50_08360 [Coriobacteriia bacterium]|jgi:antitoxin component of MazEF toxin-antitoxin module